MKVIMKLSKRVLLCPLILGFLSSSAFAEEGKFYGAFDLGRGGVHDACKGFPSTISCESGAAAFRLGLGYQANQIFSFVDPV